MQAGLAYVFLVFSVPSAQPQAGKGFFFSVCLSRRVLLLAMPADCAGTPADTAPLIKRACERLLKLWHVSLWFHQAEVLRYGVWQWQTQANVVGSPMSISKELRLLFDCHQHWRPATPD